jgi:mRNA-degrading endonuclease RelE of RelBE toxin-antitoxin system
MMPFVPMKPYTLTIPTPIVVQLQKCPATLRQAIRKRLREITDGVTAYPPARGKVAPVLGPPLRFYVSERYRVSYQVNPLTRSIVVLELRPDAG